jgi:hypothetical protein
MIKEVELPGSDNRNTKHGLTINGFYVQCASHAHGFSKRGHAEAVALVAPLPQRPLGHHPPVLSFGASWQLMTKHQAQHMLWRDETKNRASATPCSSSMCQVAFNCGAESDCCSSPVSRAPTLPLSLSHCHWLDHLF